MGIDKTKYSSVFYVLRSFAIISVVFAHSSTYSNAYASQIGGVVGLFGVPLFLICSGIFFKPMKFNKTDLKIKFQHIVLPWLIWGCFCYIISIISGGINFLSAKNCILFILGYRTWLYYVPIYLISIIVFSVNNSKIMLWGGCITTIISIALTHFGILSNQNVISHYLNPFNWIGFFTIGILLQDKIDSMTRKTVWIIVSLIFSLIFALLLFDSVVGISYFNLYALAMECLLFPSLFILAIFISKHKYCYLFQYAGQQSYIIFFLHMQVGMAIANVICNLLHIDNSWILLPFKPILVLIVTLFIVLAIKKIMSLCRISKYSRYLGIV